MRKIIYTLVTILMLSTVLAVPALMTNIVEPGSLYELDNTHPIVSISDTIEIYDGDVIIRPDRYAYYGEEIKAYAIVYDSDGVDDIASFNGKISTTAMSCSEEQISDGTLLEDYGFSAISGQEEYDSSTMVYYSCSLIVPENMFEEQYFNVVAVDSAGQPSGVVYDTEAVYMNPTLSIDVSESVYFGKMSQGETKTVSIDILHSSATTSGLKTQLLISGTDFVGEGYCPISGKLPLSYFRYSASSGSDVASNKNIPYTSFESSAIDIIPSKVYQPGEEVTLNITLSLPSLCTGVMDQGAIFVWAEAK